MSTNVYCACAGEILDMGSGENYMYRDGSVPQVKTTERLSANHTV